MTETSDNGESTSRIAFLNHKKLGASRLRELPAPFRLRSARSNACVLTIFSAAEPDQRSPGSVSARGPKASSRASASEPRMVSNLHS